jgi:hypothetical protein
MITGPCLELRIAEVSCLQPHILLSLMALRATDVYRWSSEQSDFARINQRHSHGLSIQRLWRFSCSLGIRTCGIHIGCSHALLARCVATSDLRVMRIESATHLALSLETVNL